MTKANACTWLFVPFLIAACGGSDGGDGAADSGAMGGASAGLGSAGTLTGAGASPGAGTAAGGASTTTSAGGSFGGSSSASSAGRGAGGAGNGAGAAGESSAGSSSAGSSSTGTTGPSSACKPWPSASSSTAQKLSKTQSVSKDFDGKLQRFVGDGLGDGLQGENQQPLFELADGATLENVIIGAPAADGIHCLGSCTLKNVWWEDVGEDAATLKGSSSSQVMSVDCGGAKLASDKVFQHNGPGTMKISNFYVESFGKLYRSCGNCSKQYERHSVFTGIRAQGGKDLAGVNENYKDTATFSNILVSSGTVICQRFTGNDTGAEPPATGSGPDGKVCIYQASDIHKL